MVTALIRGLTPEWISIRASSPTASREILRSLEHDRAAGLEPVRSIAIHSGPPPSSPSTSTSGVVIEARSPITGAFLEQGLRISISGPKRGEIEEAALEAARDLLIPISRTAGRLLIEPLPADPIIARMSNGLDDRARAERLAVEVAARLAGLPASAGIRPDSAQVHRIVFGDRPSPAERARLEYLYGTALLFDSGTARPPASAEARAIRGTLIHNDLSGEPGTFFGQSNPALECLAEHGRYGDRWEEHLILERVAPELSPPAVRASELRSLAGVETGKKDQRSLLRAIQAELDGTFGQYILKARKGFNSEGHLPNDQDDFVALWSRFKNEFVPERAKLRRTIDDPDELNARLNETVPAASGQVIEALLADPSSVVVQRRLPHRDELRIHVVRGKVLAGATISRWGDGGRAPDPKDARRAEAAVERMLARLGEPISLGLDLLVTDSGFAIVDLNAGLQSGFYFPEYDVRVTNLLAEHFLGHETPYLHDLRAFESAPLTEKLGAALGIEALIGDFMAKHQGCGFYDRLIAAYLQELRADPSTDTLDQIRRQLSTLKAGPRLLEQFEAARRGDPALIA